MTANVLILPRMTRKGVLWKPIGTPGFDFNMFLSDPIKAQACSDRKWLCIPLVVETDLWVLGPGMRHYLPYNIYFSVPYLHVALTT